jgi:hypothetical protein
VADWHERRPLQGLKPARVAVAGMLTSAVLVVLLRLLVKPL